MPVALSAASAAMHGAMVPIASQTFTGSTGVVTFSSIPQIYQDLMLVGFYRNDSGTNQGLNIYPNNETSNSNTFLKSDGSSATSSRKSGIAIQNYASTTTLGTGIFESTTIHILNYAQSSTFKTFISRRAADNNGSGTTELAVGLWRATPQALISLVVAAPAGNFISGSTLTLYGIRSVGQ